MKKIALPKIPTLRDARAIRRTVATLKKELAGYARLGGRMPCGVPFLVPGSGAVIIPGAPNRANAILARTRALQDSQATAQRLCRTNPNCSNAAFLFIAAGPRFFLVRPLPGGAQLWCVLIAVWMCVPLVPPPLPEDFPEEVPFK